MPRLSIDITAQELQRLKAIAALKGQSIKQYVLSRTLRDLSDTSHMTDEDAFAELAKLLKRDCQRNLTEFMSLSTFWK